MATRQFGTFEDEMLRDHVITGLQDHEHRECLLRESTLTLQKAIDICRTNEMAASQRLKMEQTDTVHLVHGNETRTRHADPRKIKNCKYCRDSHAAGNCPAFGKTCTNLNVTKKSSCKSLPLHPKHSNEKPKKKSKDEHQRVNKLNENGASDEPDRQRKHLLPAISLTKEAVHYRNSCDSEQNRKQHSNQISG